MDDFIDQLTDEIHRSRKEVSALQDRMDKAKSNSRMPCLILSGPARRLAMSPARSRLCPTG